MASRPTRPRAHHHCSFCGASESLVSKLLAGPGVFICGGCVERCNDILAGEGSPAFATLETMSDEELLATLHPASAAVESMRGMLAQRVSELRGRDVTWERIGAALGVSRQAAWERFAP